MRSFQICTRTVCFSSSANPLVASIATIPSARSALDSACCAWTSLTIVSAVIPYALATACECDERVRSYTGLGGRRTRARRAPKLIYSRREPL